MPSSAPARPASGSPAVSQPFDLAAELLCIAQSAEHLCGMWRLAAGGCQPQSCGPAEAVLIDLREWDEDEAGYGPTGLGVCRFGYEPQRLADYPDPLAVVNYTWADFYDPDEAARWRGELSAEAEAWQAQARRQNTSAARYGQAPETCDGPRVWRIDAADGDDLDERTSLMDALNERAQAAAALVPAWRMAAPARPILVEWFGRRIEANDRGHLSVYRDWLRRQPDRAATLDRLADGYLNAETAPGRFWLFTFAELRGTPHVEEYPQAAAGRSGFRGDPAAVIRWPAEAFIEVMMRLASESRGWGESDGRVLTRPAARRGGRRATSPEHDARVRQEWESGRFGTKKELAAALGTDSRDVTRSLDRTRKKLAKSSQPRDAIA